jgi:3-dehydroquinate synthase
LIRTLVVALGERSYPIHIGADLLRQADQLIGSCIGRRAVIVTNAAIAAHYLTPLRAALPSVKTDVIVMPDGEAHKSWSTLNDIVTRLLELRVDRATAIVALGGGVIGDLAGFAAAICLRGLPFVQIPTTLLAQVDSSVGGKTGVNHPLGKNLVGAFWQPRVVLIDVDCLRTLPSREVKAGLSEVIKYGAIRDVAFFDWLEQNMDNLVAREPFAFEHAVYESCRIKAEIVGGDERESGERALLNFGHTFGHAIETAENYGTWLHGEAVGAGMVLAARLSERVCGLAVSDRDRIVRLIGASDLPTSPPKIRQERWLELMARDKKVTDGRLRFVLLDAIGRGVIRSDVSNEDVAAVLTI